MLSVDFEPDAALRGSLRSLYHSTLRSVMAGLCEEMIKPDLKEKIDGRKNGASTICRGSRAIENLLL